MRTFWIVLTTILGSLLLLSSMTPAFAGTPSFFASVSGPIGVAASRDRLYVTTINDLVVSIDSSGTVSPFVTLPNARTGTFEDYIAISPGLGGFPANFVYVTQGPNIIQITPSGVATVFVNIPSLPPTHNGISFDHVGTFGFDMIVTAGFTGVCCTTGTGEVWRVSSAGVATLITTLTGTPTPALEGPEVAPLSFAPYGGQIIVASENFGSPTPGTVFAISSSGVVSTVGTWASAEGVRFISSNPCSFGSSGGYYFVTHYPTEVIKFPPSDFSGLGGSALIHSETAGTIGLFASSGGTVTATTFQSGLSTSLEGSTTVDCEVPLLTPVGGDVLSVDLVHFALPWLLLVSVFGIMAAAALFAGGISRFRLSRNCSEVWLRHENV